MTLKNKTLLIILFLFYSKKHKNKILKLDNYLLTITQLKQTNKNPKTTKITAQVF